MLEIFLILLFLNQVISYSKFLFSGMMQFGIFSSVGIFHCYVVHTAQLLL